MGKSFELLGLAAFNVFIALILSVTFLSGGKEGVTVDQLTETNVAHFIREVSAIANGEDAKMDSYAVTDYLMDHVSDEGRFRTTLQYTLPDNSTDERVLEMDKLNFISSILEGLQTARAMKQRETRVKIDYIKIQNDGRTANAVTTTYERGMVEMDNGMSDMTLMPVNGTSYCEQTFVLSDQRTIQMEEAQCTTDIDFAQNF